VRISITVIFLCISLSIFSQATPTPFYAVDWKINCPNDTIISNQQGKCGAILYFNAPKASRGTDITINQSAGISSGFFFPAGSTTNSFNATDKSGNGKQCSFLVKVVDNENPALLCPADTTITIGVSETGIKVNYSQPIATDNCHVKDLRLVDGLPSGSFFKMGVTKITYNAEDEAGNSILRSFNVTIKSLYATPPPTITAPSVIVPTKLPGNTGFNDIIDYQHIIPIPERAGCKFTFFVFDDEDEDGDTISLIFNDKVIVDRQMLHVISPYSYSNAIKVVVELDPNKKNVLISKAWNMGTHPPNTCEVDIYQGEVTSNMITANKEVLIKKLKLNARPGTAAGITLQCR
jgi:hypothetical protein